jgi:hypothetical protein
MSLFLALLAFLLASVFLGFLDFFLSNFGSILFFFGNLNIIDAVVFRFNYKFVIFIIYFFDNFVFIT